MDDLREMLAYIDIVAPRVGLTILPEHREDVAQALLVLLEQGSPVLNFALDETVEAAPRYLP